MEKKKLVAILFGAMVATTAMLSTNANAEETSSVQTEMEVLLNAEDNIAGGVIDEEYGQITWVIDAAGKLTVNGTGDFSDQKGSGRAPWYPYSWEIKSAEINVTGMTDASCLLESCSCLEVVDVSGLDTSTIIDMYAMFAGCYRLQELDVRNFNTSNVTDMSRMFLSCSSLKTIDVSNFDTSKVTDMSYMFSGCESTELDVSNFDTSKVTDMSYMFSGCESTELDVSNFDTSKVTDMSYMFSWCGSAELDVSNFDTSKVTDMGGMFNNCSSLKTIDVSNFDTSKVTDMAYMFSGCSFTELDVSNFDTSNLTDISYMFSSALVEEININGFNTENVTNMDGLFASSKLLTTIDISGFDTGNVVNMKRMFAYCQSLDEINLTTLDTSNVTNMEGMFAGCKSLKKVNVQGIDTGNVTNMMELFYNCTSLEQLDLSSFDTSNVRGYFGMFQGCSALENLNISGWETGSAANFKLMFSDCISLGEVDVRGFDTSKADSMYMMFANCSSLKEVDVSNFNTDNITSMYQMFVGCSSLTSLDLSDWDMNKVEYADDMFTGCECLEEIKAPLKCAMEITLPVAAEDDKWYFPNTTIITTLPQNLTTSVTLVKNEIPKLAAPKVTIENNASDGKPKLTWDAIDGAVKYKVYRSTSKNGEYTSLKTTTDTNYTDQNAKAGKLYYYKVKAIHTNTDANSKYSEIKSRTCDLARPVVKASNVASSGKIKLSWNAIEGAEKYKVYRATSKNGEYTFLKTITDTSYTDQKAKAGKLYYYKVKAVHSNTSANSAKSTSISRTCDLKRPVVKASNVASSGKIKLSWNAIEGAEKYKVYRATSKNGEYTFLKTITDTSYTDQKAKAGKLYYYKVKAVHSNTSANSAKSTSVSRTCDLARPVVKVSNASSGKKIKVTWSAIDGAEKYKVYRATSKNGTYKLMKTTTSTSYTNTSVSSGKTYYYKVKAVHSNTSANSAFSTIKSIKAK